MARSPSLPIESERLVLRRFRGADLAAFVAYRSDPEVARHQSWDRYTAAEGRRLIRGMRGLEPGAPGRWLQIAMEDKATGTLVGDCAIKVQRAERWQAEIGYTLAREHQRNGFALEGVARLVRFAFEDLGLRRVVAITLVENAPSIALLERLGMRREAHFRDNAWFKGTWASEYVYALLRDEWRARAKGTA